MLHLPEIRDLLYQLVPRGRWLQLEEIYALVESRRHFDEEDLRLVSDRHPEPRWKRNVRAVLQEVKQRDVEWERPARYRFPARIDTRAQEDLHRSSTAPNPAKATRAFLLTWNPARWSWDDLPSVLETMDLSGVYRDRWSVGNRVDLPIGSRVFLMRLGIPPRGLVASGWSRSQPVAGLHWDAARAERGDTTLGVEVEFDVLSSVPVLTADFLRRSPFDTLSWTPQASGVEIPAAVASALERSWALATKSADKSSTDIGSSTYLEGSPRRMHVNIFERDPAARRACINHYGSCCIVCGFSFPATYGDSFYELVHVHHCQPLSAIRAEYIVDPIRDLRPVCPNCHAALHQRAPPYTVAELQEFLRKAANGA